MASRSCTTCGGLLLDVGAHVRCPGCRAPARTWVVRDDHGRIVSAADEDSCAFVTDGYVAKMGAELGIPIVSAT